MTKPISERLMAQFSQRIAAQMGLDFPPTRWRDLERGMELAAAEFGFNAIEPCMQWLLSAPCSRQQIEILAAHLTIGESYFWRDRPLFNLLEKQLLPELIQLRRKGDRRLRFWSAGCSTGEEAYSVAILLSRLLPDLADWNVTILATDINPYALRRAAAGIYNEWSFRDVAPDFQARYFTKTGDGRYVLASPLKQLVTLAYLNLAEAVYPSLRNNTYDMDIIFCRNVLLYFAAEPAAQVVSNLRSALVDGGWLVMNPSEVAHSLFAAFDPTYFADVILYRKSGGICPPAQREPKADKPDQCAKASPSVEPRLAQPSVAASLPRESSVLLVATPYDEALTCYQQGRYTETIAIAALHQGAPDSKLFGLAARAYANLGQLGEALAWCERSIAAEPLDPLLHYLRATILQEHGRLDAAVTSLHHAIYLDQHFILAHFALAHLAWQQADRLEAAKHWRNTLALLAKRRPEELLSEADGLTAGGLGEILQMIRPSEVQS